MKSSVRILLSEVVCLSLFFTQIIGPIFVFADETGTPLVDTPTTPISQIDVSVDTGVVISPIDPATIMDSSTGLIESVSTGSESSGGTLPLLSGTGESNTLQSSGSISESGETSSPESSGSTSGTGESNTLQSSGSISLTGQVDLSIPSTPVVVPETNVSPSLNIPEPQKKMKNTPDNGNEILIQFREDNINLNTFAGKYQLDQIESVHNLMTTDTIENSNIAVLKMVDGNNQSTLKEVNSMKTSFNNNSTGAVETIIRELRKDPRIAHVQRNYIYKISSLPTIKKQDSSTIVHTQSFTDRASTNDTDFSNLWGLDNQ